MQQITSNNGLTTIKCKQNPSGYKQETDGVIPKQLNNFVLKPSDKKNDWNSQIKCTSFLIDQPTYYYLGRYNHQLYISQIHNLNKPMLFLRRDGQIWSIVAIGAYFPCTPNNQHKANAIAEPTTGGRTALRVNKDLEFYPAWALLYMSKNVDRNSDQAYIYDLQNILRLSDSKTLKGFFKKDSSSKVYVYDEKARIITNRTPQQVGLTIRMFDDYYETAVSAKSSWKAVMERYLDDNIQYMKNKAENEFFKVPVKKMKSFLMKTIQEAIVSWIFILLD